MKYLLVLFLLVGCKGKASAPAAGSASGVASGSAPVAVVVDAAVAIDAAPATPAVLEISDDHGQAELVTAFGGKVPVLPAVSADGAWIAEWGSDAGMPMTPTPMHLVLEPVGTKAKAQRVDILTYEEAEKLDGADWSETPPTGAMLKKLQERGAAVMKKLDGFASLTLVDVAEDANGNPGPAKVGDHTLTSALTDEEDLVITLADASGAPFRRETVTTYGADTCTFRPTFSGAYRHPAKPIVYVAVQYRWRDDCGQQPTKWIAWSLVPTEEDALIAQLVAQTKAGYDAKGLVAISGSDVVTDKLPFTAAGEPTDVHASIARDGKTGWASATLAPWRISTVFAKEAAGWRAIATTWTKPQPNAAVNKDAKAGKLKAPAAFTAEAGDESLRAAFATLTTDGITGDAATRADLVAFGSGPNERTVGGATLARGWNAGWKGKTAILSSVARVAPGGATGWVAANVELAKTGYKIPFRIFAVFDKSSSGNWTLVHMHFSV